MIFYNKPDSNDIVKFRASILLINVTSLSDYGKSQLRNIFGNQCEIETPLNKPVSILMYLNNILQRMQ